MADTRKTRRSVQMPLLLAILAPLATSLPGPWMLAFAYDRKPRRSRMRLLGVQRQL